MLNTVDLSLTLDSEEYSQSLVRYQMALHALAFQAYRQARPVIVLFEGWDAAGKGGAIRRFTEKLDPRGYVVYPVGAPKGDEATHHYLWRFWNRLPETGQIAIFDRSWYGRVLVERIEGYCREDEWKRAYREINQFERQLVDFGTLLCKFWIHVSKEEQLKRFEDRAADPRRSWKLTSEDWRNRDKWDLYEQAVNDMLMKTSTVSAPWTIVEGNDKGYARVKVLKTLTETLSKGLDYDPLQVTRKVKKDEKNSQGNSKKAKKKKEKNG